MNQSAITVTNLNKVYKLYRKPSDRLRDALGLGRKKLYTELHALKDVSFTIGQGETVGIIGTNGSGKSTILKIITGVVNPTSGTVDVNGRISALLELGAGFNQEYTGIENIYLNGTMMGFSREEIDARMESILKFADIGDFVNQPVKTYSSGMFVRLAFALAINIDPEILIVDEALSVGDVFFQAKCYHKFEEFKKQGKTILFVSHDLGSIAKYCDRVILLNKGDLVAQGGPKEIVDLYKQLLVDYGDDTEEGLPEEQGHTELSETEESGAAKNSSAFLPLQADTLEYGEGQAHIAGIRVFDDKGRMTNTIDKGSAFRIEMTVRFLQPVHDPIFAFTIKNAQGTELTGTNTMLEGVPTGEMLPGSKVTVTFRQNMSLQGGAYLLSFGCTGYQDGEFRVFHRLYDAVDLRVVSSKNTVGFYDMDSAVTLEISGMGAAAAAKEAGMEIKAETRTGEDGK